MRAGISAEAVFNEAAYKRPCFLMLPQRYRCGSMRKHDQMQF